MATLTVDCSCMQRLNQPLLLHLTDGCGCVCATTNGFVDTTELNLHHTRQLHMANMVKHEVRKEREEEVGFGGRKENEEATTHSQSYRTSTSLPLPPTCLRVMQKQLKGPYIRPSDPGLDSQSTTAQAAVGALTIKTNRATILRIERKPV